MPHIYSFIYTCVINNPLLTSTSKRVAASCIWHASKLVECKRKARDVLVVFHRMECRRENEQLHYLDLGSKNYMELEKDLVRLEKIVLRELGFVCHVNLPYQPIPFYLHPLEAPHLMQEAYKFANDSLRTTLCVRLMSEVVACGVAHAAAGPFRVSLPENPPWWEVFDADKAGINDHVCRVLANLYSLPKANYIMQVCIYDGSFTTNKSSEAAHAFEGNTGSGKHSQT